MPATATRPHREGSRLRLVRPTLPPMDEAAPRRLDGYRLGPLLGTGGMSRVFRATQSRMDREVALKIMSPEQGTDELAVHRFVREGRLGGRVQHTNVVNYHELREDRGWLYMALEYVPGGDLRELIRKHKGQVPERLALGLMRDVACGLEAVARCGVVHRDIKPHNIFLTEDMIPKIADFGVAIPAAAALQRKDVERRRGLVIGSPRYMAPEQADPKTHVDARADIHALGATLWQLLFGQAPFRGDGIKQTLRELVDGPVPDPAAQGRRITRRSCEILVHCLAKDPAERYQTPRAVVAAIEHALHAAATEDGRRASEVRRRTATDPDPDPAASELPPPETAPPSALPYTWSRF